MSFTLMNSAFYEDKNITNAEINRQKVERIRKQPIIREEKMTWKKTF